jgi:hypothetical protein
MRSMKGRRTEKRLEHFHFWCIQSNRSQRGFFLKKSCTYPRLPVQSRSENALEGVLEGVETVLQFELLARLLAGRE